MKSKGYTIILLPISLIILISALASLASAADPGHGASVIGSGTFESGNYTFPAWLNVNYIAIPNNREMLMINEKVYKLEKYIYINIHPGDSKDLPDDYFLFNSFLGGALWKKL